MSIATPGGATNLQRVPLVLVVFGVRLQVIDVDRWQSGDEQLQLLLVEDRDETLRDDVIESLEESVQLLADRSRHAQLTHELHVLLLAALNDLDVATVRHNVAHLRHAKLSNLPSQRGHITTSIEV